MTSDNCKEALILRGNNYCHQFYWGELCPSQTAGSLIVWGLSIVQGLSMLMAPEQAFIGKETAFAAEKHTHAQAQKRSYFPNCLAKA